MSTPIKYFWTQAHMIKESALHTYIKSIINYYPLEHSGVPVNGVLWTQTAQVVPVSDMTISSTDSVLEDEEHCFSVCHSLILCVFHYIYKKMHFLFFIDVMKV